jgi:tetratricopeptide (TPR) repeat protein
VGKGYSVQANLMDKATVWPAMARAYESAQGDLAERILQALEAAEREGGDIRGRQSAAIIIVGPENTGRPWADRVFDLRVEDHPQPLVELRRLVTLGRVYANLNAGDAAVTRGDMAAAGELYGKATSILPDAATNGEAVFWTGISYAAGGRVDEALPWLRRAHAVHARWADLIPRLPAAGLLPNDPALIQRLVAGMRQPPR